MEEIMRDFNPTLVEWDHGTARMHKYPNPVEQLDMLWHDINNGVFGEGAKQSSWFKAIDAIKAEYPKGGIVKPYVNVGNQ